MEAAEKSTGAFLELGEELWDGDQQRFTLLLRSGPRETGTQAARRAGAGAHCGRESYTLVVDDDWRDATRTPLNAGGRKSFRSVRPTTPIDPGPLAGCSAGGRQSRPAGGAVRRTLDHSLFERIVWVADTKGTKFAGTIATGDGEACWQFTPNEPWPAGNYKLVAETTLEDLAGNAIGRPFEVDQFDQVDKQAETKTIEREFTVGQPSH